MRIKSLKYYIIILFLIINPMFHNSVYAQGPQDTTKYSIRGDIDQNIFQSNLKMASSFTKQKKYRHAIISYMNALSQVNREILNNSIRRDGFSKKSIKFQKNNYRKYRANQEFLWRQQPKIYHNIALNYEKMAQQTQDAKTRKQLLNKAGFWYWQAALNKYRLKGKNLVKKYRSQIEDLKKALSYIDFKTNKVKGPETLSKKDLSVLGNLHIKIATQLTEDNKPEALKTLKKALKYYKDAQNTYSQIEALLKIGLAYESLGNSKQAMETYKKASYLSAQMGNIYKYQKLRSLSHQHIMRLEDNINTKKPKVTSPICLNHKNDKFNMKALFFKRRKKVRELSQELERINKEIKQHQLLLQSMESTHAQRALERLRKFKRNYQEEHDLLRQTLPCEGLKKTVKCHKPVDSTLPLEIRKKQQLISNVDKHMAKRRRSIDNQLQPYIDNFLNEYKKVENIEGPKAKIRSLKKYLQKLPQHVANDLKFGILKNHSKKRLLKDLKNVLLNTAQASREVAFLAEEFFEENDLRSPKMPKERLMKLVKKWGNKGVSPDVLINSWQSAKKILTLNAVKFCLASNPHVSGDEIANSELAELLPTSQLKKIAFNKQAERLINEYFLSRYRAEFLLGDLRPEAQVKLTKEIRNGKKLIESLSKLKKHLKIWNININKTISNVASMASKVARAQITKLKKMKKNRGEPWYKKMLLSVPRLTELVIGHWIIVPLVVASQSFHSRSWSHGVEMGAHTSNKIREFGNKCWGSPLGTDLQIANSSYLQLLLAANPIIQAGKGVGAAFEGLNELYILYARWAAGGLTRDEFDNAIEEQWSWANAGLKGGFIGWETFKFAGGLLLYLHMGGHLYKGVTSKEILKASSSAIAPSAGLSFLGALGQELIYASHDGKKLITWRRLSRIGGATLSGIANNMVFLNMLTAGGAAYGKYYATKYMRSGANPLHVMEVAAKKSEQLIKALDILEATGNIDQIFKNFEDISQRKGIKNILLQLAGSLLIAEAERRDAFDGSKAGAPNTAAHAVMGSIQNKTMIPTISKKVASILLGIADYYKINVENEQKIKGLFKAFITTNDNVDKRKKLLLQAGFTSKEIKSLMPNLKRLQDISIFQGHLLIARDAFSKSQEMITLASKIHKQGLTGKSELVRQIANYLSENKITDEKRILLASKLLGRPINQDSPLYQIILELHQDGPGIYQHSHRELAKKKRALINALLKVNSSPKKAKRQADLLVRCGICGKATNTGDYNINIIFSDTQSYQQTAWEALPITAFKNRKKSTEKDSLRDDVQININGDLMEPLVGRSIEVKKKIGSKVIGQKKDIFYKNLKPGNQAKNVVTAVDQLDNLAKLAENNPDQVKILLGNHDMAAFLSLLYANLELKNDKKTTENIMNILYAMIRTYDSTYSNLNKFKGQAEAQGLFIQQLWEVSDRQLDLSKFDDELTLGLMTLGGGAGQKAHEIVEIALKEMTADERQQMIEKSQLTDINGEKLDKNDIQGIHNSLAKKTLESLVSKIAKDWRPLMHVCHFNKKDGKLHIHGGISSNFLDQVDKLGGFEKYDQNFREQFQRAINDKNELKKFIEQYNKDDAPFLVTNENQSDLGKKFPSLGQCYHLLRQQGVKHVYRGHTKNQPSHTFSIGSGTDAITFFSSDHWKGSPRRFIKKKKNLTNTTTISSKSVFDLAKEIKTKQLNVTDIVVKELAEKIERDPLTKDQRMQLLEILIGINLKDQDKAILRITLGYTLDRTDISSNEKIALIKDALRAKLNYALVEAYTMAELLIKSGMDRPLKQ